jgi:hypothetical protein
MISMLKIRGPSKGHFEKERKHGKQYGPDVRGLATRLGYDYPGIPLFVV